MQDNYIFADTLKANIVLGNKPDDHKVNEALDAACLRHFVDDHPLGLEMKLGSDGVGVSGGEKQRIMIARLSTNSRHTSCWTRPPVRSMRRQNDK